jgi:small-conductance mechanosensitive channel
MLPETVHAPALMQTVPANTWMSVFVIVSLLVVGLLAWLVAMVLGFARARAFRPSTRWFALSALCVLLYHLHLVAFGFLGTQSQDMEKLLSFGAFFNVWNVLGGICAIIGFLRLTNPRP